LPNQQKIWRGIDKYYKIYYIGFANKQRKKVKGEIKMRFKVIKQIAPEVKQTEGKNFYYIPWGKEKHGKVSFITWVNRNLVNEDGRVFFPIYGKLIKTEKGSLVIRPAENGETGYWIFPVEARCGYRGSSEIEVIKPADTVLLKYYVYSSPLGNLGISECALVITSSFPIKFHASYSGRLYGDPKDEYVIIESPDLNPVISAENLDDVKEYLE